MIEETTIYPIVVGVGGKQKPYVTVDLESGERAIKCHFRTEVKDDETALLEARRLAKKLGARLYETVGFIGQAKRNPETYKIEQFTVYEVLPYEEMPVDEAFRAMSQKIGELFKDIKDPDEFARRLRTGLD